MFTATSTHSLIDPRTGATVDAEVDTIEPLTAEAAARWQAGLVGLWKHLGYTVREGDGWATGAAADVKATLTVDRLTPAEVAALEAAEAAGDAEYDAWKNR